MAKVPLPVRIDEGLLARLDEIRGDVSRTRFVERAIEAALMPVVIPAGSEPPVTFDFVHGEVRTPTNVIEAYSSASSVPMPDIDAFKCPKDASHSLTWNRRKGRFICQVCVNLSAVKR